MKLKSFIKRRMLKRKNIILDCMSSINYNVIHTNSERACIVNDSNIHISSMGEGCFFEHVYAYGDIELDNNISISGPGTVLHAVKGKIKIGSYTSIAPNVTITEFNHDINRPSTYAFGYNIFHEEFKNDVTSKGNITIGEDVWVGSNVCILSGLNIGRGAVIAAGAVVNKDVEPYSIVGGVPARLIKMRFSQEKINKLESMEWWKWDHKKILENKSFFETSL